jgi:TonB family protein
MQLTLLESDRSFLRSTEGVVVSVVAHLGVLWMIVSATAGGITLPVTERDARVFFLLPPDRVPASERQADLPHPGALASGFEEGELPGPGQGLAVQAAAVRSRRHGQRSGPRLRDLAAAPTLYMPDSVYSVLEVDQMVERYATSAAPIYPPELMQRGTEGQVEATYVVDTLGRVDTTTIQVLRSDHPKFTESVRTALGDTRFRPAKRAGKSVRQLVKQRFRFQIAPGSMPAAPR